jgi:RNA polymerase sigma-70 factor (sigma-E family)
MQINMAADPPLAVRANPGTDIDQVIAELHAGHALSLIRLANLLVRDPQLAEDVVQDAFIGLYRAMPRLTDHNAVLPYLRTAVINRSRSALRARNRALRRALPQEPPGVSAESAVLDRAERDDVLAAVGRLPRRAREILVLRYYLDLPDLEIAAALGISRGTVSSTASRALTALAGQLKENQ